MKHEIYEESSDNRGILAFQQTLGGKWKVVLLRLLQKAEPARFSDLRRGLDGITEAMLTKQLRELERDGYVRREVFPVVPPHVEYSLTEIGQSVMPLLDVIDQWGRGYLEKEV